MRLNGQEIVGRSTQIVIRTLLIISSAAIAVVIFDLRPVHIPMLQNELEIDTYKWITIFLLAFLVLSLTVNWLADFSYFKNSFSKSEINRGTLIDDIATDATEHPIKAIERRLGHLKDSIPDLERSIAAIDPDELARYGCSGGKDHVARLDALESKGRKITNSIESLDHHLASIRNIVDELPERLKSLSNYAKFYLYVWSLLLPLLFGVTAICLTYSIDLPD